MIIIEDHISKRLWTPYTGEELPLNCKEGNVYDKHVVAVRNKANAVAAHLERCRVPCLLVSHVIASHDC